MSVGSPDDPLPLDPVSDEAEDPEDVFGSSLFSLYAELPPNIAPSATTGVLTYRGISVASPHTNKWELQAHGIWRSALHLVDRVEDVSRRLAPTWKWESSIDVLELGACSGLPGLHLARMMHPRSMTFSDYPDAAILHTLRSNVEANRSSIPESVRTHIVGHIWGDIKSVVANPEPEDSSQLGSWSYDLIIAADTLWMGDQHDNLARTLAECLRRSPESIVFLVAGLHTGRHPIEHFLGSAREVGLLVREIREASISIGENDATQFRDWVPERDGETNAERSLWLVEIVLGFSDAILRS